MKRPELFREGNKGDEEEGGEFNREIGEIRERVEARFLHERKDNKLATADDAEYAESFTEGNETKKRGRGESLPSPQKGFLLGELFMKQADPAKAFTAFIEELNGKINH